MLKGDLTTTPIDIALAALADEAATGCLHVVDDEGSEALIYLKSGLIYAVSVPGQRPQLGARLISSNVLVPENLAEALEAQRTELQGWRLGELLVHLGLVEQEVVEAFVQEQVRDGFTDLMAWTSGRWRFRKAEKTREDVGPPTPLDELLGEVRRRQDTWTDIVSAVHGPNAVPMLAARGGEADVTLDSDTWSLLCKIDGERSIADLARECGFTLFEAGTVVRALVEAGLVDVEEDVGPDGDPLDVEFDSDDDAASVADEVEEEADDESEEEAPASDRLPRTAALAAAFALSGKDIPPAKDSPSHATSHQPFSIEELHEWDVARSVGDEGVSTLAQVSEALTKALGPRKESANAFVDPFHVPDEIRLRAAPKIASAPAEFSEEQLRRDRLRQAAAAELAAAHAEAEAMHSITKDASKVGHIAQVVDLEARRGAARAEAQRREAERVEAEEAARVGAERIAAAEEAARAEAERVAAEEAARVEAEEAARVAAEEEAARLEAERIAAEEAARVAAEEEARLEAERIAAEEEASRLEAERIAAEEEAARLEAERIAAEEEASRLEAERIAAEEEAARAEAERIAAEEAARIAAEEEAARLEAERVAAEEEAARIEAERVAAEETARTDAERAAAEEAARVAAEEEAARIEAERVEAERIAAEEEVARATAQEEATRIAAEEEAARLEAERIAAEEAARFAAEQQAARIAADELARTEEERDNAAREARAQFAAAQAAAEEAAALAAEDEARKAAELAESERIEAVNQMMAHASAPTADPRHFASANAMLSEFSRNGATTLESTDEEPAAEQAPEYEPMPAPVAQRDLADTASLLRELSSLGFEDEPPAPAGPRPGASTPGPNAPRPVTTSAAQKKKRGLFGR